MISNTEAIQKQKAKQCIHKEGHRKKEQRQQKETETVVPGPCTVKTKYLHAAHTYTKSSTNWFEAGCRGESNESLKCPHMCGEINLRKRHAGMSIPEIYTTCKAALL